MFFALEGQSEVFIFHHVSSDGVWPYMVTFKVSYSAVQYVCGTFLFTCDLIRVCYLKCVKPWCAEMLIILRDLRAKMA